MPSPCFNNHRVRAKTTNGGSALEMCLRFLLSEFDSDLVDAEPDDSKDSSPLEEGLIAVGLLLALDA